MGSWKSAHVLFGRRREQSNVRARQVAVDSYSAGLSLRRRERRYARHIVVVDTCGAHSRPSVRLAIAAPKLLYCLPILLHPGKLTTNPPDPYVFGLIGLVGIDSIRYEFGEGFEIEPVDNDSASNHPNASLSSLELERAGNWNCSQLTFMFISRPRELINETLLMNPASHIASSGHAPVSRNTNSCAYKNASHISLSALQRKGSQGSEAIRQSVVFYMTKHKVSRA